ncbi:MAG TPA: DUF2752 domain-containing protein [Luteolibacter sp.]|nr:DUF2752 domain-containing protein [Luteolibacter sp.]
MKAGRALWVALTVLVLAYAAFHLRQHGNLGSWFPGCLFHRVTGLHCPGCGMTRATYAALHGNFGLAFRMNPVGVILLPIALGVLGIQIIGWVRGKRLNWFPETTPKLAWALAILVIVFWILRNIPCWPFTLLAPI